MLLQNGKGAHSDYFMAVLVTFQGTIAQIILPGCHLEISRRDAIVRQFELGARSKIFSSLFFVAGKEEKANPIPVRESCHLFDRSV